MDHRYIDAHSVAKRYLDHELTAAERARFEAHLVDCQECTDRVLLAEMFHSRNGIPKNPDEIINPPGAGAVERKGVRLRFALMLKPWQFYLVVAMGLALLVLVPLLLIVIIRR